jgi:hypothetical protein
MIKAFKIYLEKMSHDGYYYPHTIKYYSKLDKSKIADDLMKRSDFSESGWYITKPLIEKILEDIFGHNFSDPTLTDDITYARNFSTYCLNAYNPFKLCVEVIEID